MGVAVFGGDRMGNWATSLGVSGIGTGLSLSGISAQPPSGSASEAAAQDESVASDAPAIAVHLVEPPQTTLGLVPGAAVPWTDLALERRLQDAAIQALGSPILDGTGYGSTVAISLRHLPTGASASINADLPIVPASVYKLGVLGEVFSERAAGQLSLGDRLSLIWDDWEDGAGVLQGRIGDVLPVEELVRLMIGVSDNIAANVLVRRVGLESVNRWYQSHDLRKTYLTEDDRPYNTTSAETADLLTQLVTGQLADEDATAQMLNYMAQEQPAAWIRPALPPDVIVAHKSGQIPGVRNDAAIIFGPSGPYVLVIFTNNLWDDTTGEAVIASVARAAHTYLSETYPPAFFQLATLPPTPSG